MRCYFVGMRSTSTTVFSVGIAVGIAFSAVGCAAAATDDAQSAGSADSAESADTSAAMVHGHAVKKLGAVFARPVQGIATEAAAHALEAKLRDDARENAFEQCAATLALPIGAVSTKLVGLASNVTKDASDGRFVVTASTVETYCSSASLDDAVLATFDGKLHGAGTLRAGGKILLDPGLDRVVGDVSELGHVVATRAHVVVRFDGGSFREVTGLAGAPTKKGGTIDVELPFAEDALLFDVTSAADRFEMFFRVERWNVSGFFEDGNFTGTLVAPAADAFVSDFGANYRLPVVK